MASLTKTKQTLSDGSCVYDLVLTTDSSLPNRVKFNCVSEADADQLARVLTIAIENHTMECMDDVEDLS